MFKDHVLQVQMQILQMQMHLRESKYSFILGKQILLVFTLAVIHMRHFSSWGFFVKNQKVRMISYAQKPTDNFSCNCDSPLYLFFQRGKRFSQSFGDTLCWQKTENLLETTPHTPILHAHVIALLQNMVSTTALFYNIT